MTKTRQDFPVNSVAIELEFVFETSPEELWPILTARMGEWWRKPYSCCHTREHFELELRAGGRLFEVGDGGAEHIWGTVRSVRKNYLLEIDGPIGMSGLVNGWVQFALDKREGGTVLKLDHRIIGAVDDNTASIYCAGWKDMFENRLKSMLIK